MDFTLSEEQKMLQRTVRDFATDKLAPVADVLDQAQEFPLDNFKMMAGLELVGMALPARYGGGGASFVSLAVAMEEVARACASTCDILNAHQMLCAEPIALYGSEEQKKRFLPPLASGEKIGSFAVTEAEAGSDIGNIQTTAVRDGDDYILNGAKIFITNGDVCDTVVVFARIPQLEKRGMTAFIVEKDTPGFSKGKKFHKLGMRAGTAAELIFEDCRLPAANRLGEEGQGMKIALAAIDYGRIGIAAQGIGLAQAVLDRASDYAKERVQCGVPIGRNQAIAWMLADIAVQLEGARLLNYQTAYLADQGAPFGKQAAMAKLSAGELAMRASTQGIQIFGGYGYMMDSPMQRYFRDAKLIEIYEGTSEVQRMVISRALLK
jgi:alkylation response protein AidB-like acyl-CoA dehydrogenase